MGNVVQYLAAALVAILSLLILVIGYGPVIDYWVVFLGQQDGNPYANTAIMVFKFVYSLICLSVFATIYWAYKGIVAEAKYWRAEEW